MDTLKDKSAKASAGRVSAKSAVGVAKGAAIRTANPAAVVFVKKLAKSSVSRDAAVDGDLITRPHAKIVELNMKTRRSAPALDAGRLLYGSAADIFGSSAGMMIEQIRSGFPATVVADVATTVGMSQDKFYEAVGLPKSTIKNRIAQGKPLSPSEGDRLYRVARILQRAVEVLEDRDAAKQWLQRRNRSLGGVAPLSMLDTEAGYELVMDTLGRIEQGVAA